MAENPNGYLFRFFDIPVSTVRGDVEYINVKRYLSGSTDRNGDKSKVFNKLQSFVRFSKSRETGEPYQQGEWFVDPRLHPHGRIQYSWTKVLAPFNGKGTPESYSRFLHLVDFWLAFGCKGMYRPVTWTSVPTLKKFVNDYMGVDCNSFVGGFFQVNYPATGWHTSVDWNKAELKRGPQRQSIDDVQPLDVLVQYKGKKEKHVAVIDDIWGKKGSKATAVISQSAGSAGGLWSGMCTLEITASGKAITSNGYRCDFDEGAFGVIGANSF
ncbi:MAG: hypothetical protein AB1757_29755 [Acidobacteriota bacterium]